MGRINPKDYDPEPTIEDWKWLSDQFDKIVQDYIKDCDKKLAELDIIEKKNKDIIYLTDVYLYLFGSQYGPGAAQYQNTEGSNWLFDKVKREDPDWANRSLIKLPYDRESVTEYKTRLTGYLGEMKKYNPFE